MEKIHNDNKHNKDIKNIEDKIDIVDNINIENTNLENVNLQNKKNIDTPNIDKKNISKNYIEIWEDIVHIKDLLIAFFICVSTTFFGYFLAPNEPPKPLFFGLIGTIIGFIISSIIINPKREFVESDGEN